MINPRIWVRTAGALFLIISAAFMICGAVGMIYDEPQCISSFMIPAVILAPAGSAVLFFVRPAKRPASMRDGLFIVPFIWLVMSVIGTVPLVASGSIPSVADAFFEMCSGFSTTGATVLKDVESLPTAVLFWRAFSQWIGGMGVMALAMALFKGIGDNMQNVFKAESPGPSLAKALPRISDTAKMLYITYCAMTLILALLLLMGGMSFFDAVTHALSTVGTGGFSNYNDSLMHFDSVYIDTVITVFMILSAVNYNLYYIMLSGDPKHLIKDEEFRFYIKIILTFSLIISLSLFATGTCASLGDSVSKGFFQVASIVSTTGFASADFVLWPTFATILLFFLFCVGGCSSSPAGGMKVVRVMMLLKIMKRHITLLLHPNAMVNIRVNRRPVDVAVTQNVISFAFLYVVVLFVVSLAVTVDGFDIMTSVSAAAACLGNVGPGFASVGPVENFSVFSDPIKVILSLTMLCGRLEIFPMLMFLSTRLWRYDR